jgi:hypothetical protein
MFKYNVLKEVNGEFSLTGDTFEVEEQSQAQKEVEKLQATNGGCYAAELVD